MAILMEHNQNASVPLGRRALSCLGIASLILTTGACASTGSTPRPFPMPGASVPATHPAPPSAAAAPEEPAAAAPATVSPARRTTDAAYALVGTALDLRGAPYRSGGGTP